MYITYDWFNLLFTINSNNQMFHGKSEQVLVCFVQSFEQIQNCQKNFLNHSIEVFLSWVSFNKLCEGKASWIFGYGDGELVFFVDEDVDESSKIWMFNCALLSLSNFGFIFFHIVRFKLGDSNDNRRVIVAIDAFTANIVFMLPNLTMGNETRSDKRRVEKLRWSHCIEIVESNKNVSKR